jgi:hypothetical protein
MFEKDIPKGAEDKIEIFYEGVPVGSRNPPEYHIAFSQLDRIRTLTNSEQIDQAVSECATPT